MLNAGCDTYTRVFLSLTRNISVNSPPAVLRERHYYYWSSEHTRTRELAARAHTPRDHAVKMKKKGDHTTLRLTCFNHFHALGRSSVASLRSKLRRLGFKTKRESCLQSFTVNSDWSEEMLVDAPNLGHRAESQALFPALAAFLCTDNTVKEASYSTAIVKIGDLMLIFHT